MNAQIDFSAPDIIADPYPALNVLREQQPVCWNETIKSWCITRYEDIAQACRDARFSSDRIRPFLEYQRRAAQPLLKELGECISLWMVFNDPPTHTRLRKLTQKVFTRKAVEALRPAIERLVNQLIDQVSERTSMDFVRDFAYPLPALVIADMLGVPREHVGDLKRWSDDLAQFVLSSRINPDKYEMAARSLHQMNELFDHLIQERQQKPGDSVMDTLIAAHTGGHRLNRDELLAFCVLLLFAGHETTTHFFANGLRALLLHPAQLGDLQAVSDDSRRLNNALSEMLRWEGPILAVSRFMAEDVVMHGQRMRAGSRVYLFNAAANRDPRVFVAPNRFDIRRPDADRMITFGFGIHLCLGIHLARLEALVAFPILLRRLRNISLVSDDLEWSDTMVIRGPKTLPVIFESS